jgi:diguanylate cyclase (GGDEF)-like protein
VRFHHGQFLHYQVPGLLNTAAIAPDGSYWIGTDHGGLSHIQNGRVISVTTRDGLLSDFAQAVYVDRDGVVWAGTSPGGLNRIADGRITTYSIDQGLYDLTVGAIVEDNQGYLWMTCNRGIYKVSRKELNDYASGRVHRIHSSVYTTADGLRSAECNFAGNPAVWKGAGGNLWFVTTAGVVTVDPEHSGVRVTSPSAVIEEVHFRGKLLPFDRGITAGPDTGDLDIQFTAPDFTAPDRVRFHYRLIGFDADWIDAGDRREAIYTKLPPGHYLFEVQAGGAGVIGSSSKTAQMQIRITPHLWQTGWFRILCGLTVMLVCFISYRMRVQYLVEHAALLELRVDERTAELQVAIQAAEEAKRALRDQAMRDGLTGLWNRSAILEMLGGELDRADRDNLPLCVLMVDVDHFKQINDSSGHIAGDRVLEAIAQCIMQHIRGYDLAGRYGGEEFLVVLPGCSVEVGRVRANELRRRIAEVSGLADSGPLQITCSVGLANHRSGATVEDMVRAADEALYDAKRSGRNCVRVAEKAQESVSSTKS